MERPDHLAAELRRSAVVEPDLLDPTADPLARLQHGDVGAAGSEVACRGQAGQAGAEHEDVGQAVAELAARACRASARAHRSRSRRPR